MIVDLDATLVGAHSEKEQAAPTYKRGFGFHPMLAFVVLDAALAPLPEQALSRVLVRGRYRLGVKAFLAHVDDLGLRFSVGMNLRGLLPDVLDLLPQG